MANKTAVIAATIAATLLTVAVSTEITTYAVTNTVNPVNLITFEKANALAKKMEFSKKDCEALKDALKGKLATGTLKYENDALTWSPAEKDDAGKPMIKPEEIKNNWAALKAFLASEDAKMKKEKKEETANNATSETAADAAKNAETAASEDAKKKEEPVDAAH